MFITFDGPNGSGKSTIVSGVATRLIQLGFKVYQTKEPTLTPLGQYIKNSEDHYKGKTYACLVAADRYYHIDNEILPALSDGNIVLSDRYIESSLVLQRLDGVEIDFIWDINSKVIIPDLSVCVVALPETLDKRLAQRNQYSRFEIEKSRVEEFKYYHEAMNFISQRGFNVLSLNNDDFNSLSNNIEIIVNNIIIY